MSVVPLVMLATFGWAADSDPATLVRQLGSPRYAEREAAADALGKMGSRALPALRQALASKDPEVQTRTSALAAKIESEELVKPTLVTLDFRDQPLNEVVQALSERGGISIMPVNEVALGGGRPRRVTLVEPEPVPLWKAIDQLCRAHQLRPAPSFLQAGVSPARPTIQLGAADPEQPYLSSESGPFQFSISTAHIQKTINFNNPRAFPQNVPGRPGGGSTAMFSLTLQVMAEPRMTIAQGGPLALQEAVDERGQSLLPQSSSTTQITSGYSGYVAGAGSASFQVQAPLKFPDPESKAIKKLKGTLPLVISSRKPDPLLISLAEAQGKTFRSGDNSLIVHEIKPAEANAGRSTVELTLRTHSDGGDGASGPLDVAAFRGFDRQQNRIEILDAQGRILQAHPTQTQSQPGETRMTLMVLPGGNGGAAPTQLRFYDVSQATAQVPFEFTDVPIP